DFNELQQRTEPADDTELSFAFKALNFPIGFLEQPSFTIGSFDNETELPVAGIDERRVKELVEEPITRGDGFA
ncbi:hypothetical protein A2U01_0049766, partial [Trifolium medium]|nr:hypothetical protein [Trifolium medium]